MVKLHVQKLEGGEKISEDVHTALGGTLFSKGKIIHAREIDILKAFLIKSIHIENEEGNQETNEVEEDTEEEENDRRIGIFSKRVMFREEYETLLEKMKKYFYNASSGITPPLLDIRTQLEKVISQIDDYNIISFVPANMLKEDYLYHNSIMVALSSYQLARWHHVDRKDWVPIAMGGLLHDIGMIRMDPDILKKRIALTRDDTEHIRRHTIVGYNMLKNVTGINEGVKLCALQHHEKIDGSGYPLKVIDEKIHFYAKIVGITDIYHAMTSDRIHKKRVSPYLVLEELWQESFGKLDPAFVQTFMNKVTAFHHGIIVKLSDNSVGEIVFSERNSPTRPWVKVNGKIINLTTQRDLYINEVLKK